MDITDKTTQYSFGGTSPDGKDFNPTQFKTIKIERFEKHVALLWLNHGSKANALDDTLIRELVQGLEILEVDSSVRAIVLAGEGRHFSAGGDVKAMKNSSGMFKGKPAELRQNYMLGIQSIPRQIEAMETPIVAAVCGSAIGAGLDLACMADMRICSDEAKFGETFVRLGLISGDGGAFFLSRVVGYAKAMEMTLTGNVIGAVEAEKIGLVSEVVPKNELFSRATAIASQIAANAPVAVRMAKALLKQNSNQQLPSQLISAATCQGIAQRTGDHELFLKSLGGAYTPEFKGQ